ncbi:alpha/beta hydrolase [Aureibaculum sp. 2210JD6-5]|uniref:alpha/beta fold hydrolase n=1 Tax=Aureibaculum sp. 2210JD6-5 TaxID=3103957 RepID=UPI002AAC7075|nr:alpha/beta hydrolase [Aureibaculum sp. 2210JD6-5]MDY7395416.1 alpha/beta hydrolase [Aureibaculum sp. 2210JD6-5]
MPNKNTFEVPSSIVRTGQLLQLFSTKLAAKFVNKLFVTPPQFKIPEREEMMRKSAKNILVDIQSIQKEVNIYEYGFSKTKILLVHGWAGRGTQLYEIADKLLENGMMVISVDLPAHGLSAGKTTNLLECITTLEHLNEKYGPFEAAIGHSFGGITLLASLAKHSFLKKLVVIGIEGSNNKILDLFVKKLNLKPKVAKLMKKQIKSKFNVDLESLAALESAKKIIIPTLVVHDTQDNDVDVSSAYKIRQNLTNGRLLITNGLGHRKILRDHDTIFRIIDFLKK